MKAILERAGKLYVRPETGFVHYTYHKKGEEGHATIPLYENLCWALANFMLKTQEGVQEGKRLLKRLLAFQNSDGEFPVYLHEYPEASDQFLGAYLFHPLYLIQKEYGHVLGSELKEALQKGIDSLIVVLEKRFNALNPTGHIRIKVGSALMAAGRPQGEALLKDAPLSLPSSFHLADCELARDLGATMLPLPSEFYWHPQLKTYAGPAYKERQEGDQPELTLLDLMRGDESKRALTPHHLALALVRSSPLSSSSPIKGVYSAPSFCWAALEQVSTIQGYEPGFHLFRLLAEGEGKIDSLAIPGGGFQKVTFTEKGSEVRFQFHLSETFDPENRDRSREIELFFNLGIPYTGSTFRLNEPLVIAFKTVNVTLKFALLQGTGDFIGHRARGNRPAQLLKTGVYDEMLYLRTLRRSSDAVIELAITCDPR